MLYLFLKFYENPSITFSKHPLDKPTDRETDKWWSISVSVSEVISYNHVVIDLTSVLSHLCTLTTWHCPHSLAACRSYNSRSISPTRRAHSSKCAAAGLLLWAHAGTDRRTDTVPLHRPCCSYHAVSANNQGWYCCKSVVACDQWLRNYLRALFMQTSVPCILYFFKDESLTFAYEGVWYTAFWVMPAYVCIRFSRCWYAPVASHIKQGYFVKNFTVVCQSNCSIDIHLNILGCSSDPTVRTFETKNCEMCRYL